MKTQPSLKINIRGSRARAVCSSAVCCVTGVLFTLCGSYVAALGEDPAPEHPLLPAIRLTQQSQQVLQQIDDYEATLVKREMINGKLTSQRLQLRLKERPLSIYVKFEEPAAGREILFVQGQNDNQLLAHEGSGLTALVGTVSLPLDSPKVLAENRHVITDIGMRRMLDLVLAQWELESRYGEIEVRFYPQARMGNAECEVIETSHPKPRKQFPFQMTRLFLEKQSRLPIRIENYAFPADLSKPPQLAEEYTYLNVRTNIGMTAADFDRRNQRYSFR